MQFLRKTLTSLLITLLALTTKAAFAHVGLATTVPGHDAVMDQAPTKIVFQFMAEVTITNLRLEITDGVDKGKRLNVHLPRNSIGQSTAFGENIILDLPPLNPATYQVTYQAVSIGGDILVDDFSFTVQAK